MLVACAPSVVSRGEENEKLRMTSNKRALSFFAERVATLPVQSQHLVRERVEWVNKARWVVHDPDSSSVPPIWSASGVSAGIDMIFAFVASVFGEETSKLVADYIEYERHLDPSWDPYADLYGLV